MKEFFQYTKQSILVTFMLLIICGLIYPFAVTAVAQMLFNHQANGSFIDVDGEWVGSEIVGQDFTAPEYFWGRVSAVNYNTYTKKDLVPDANGETAYSGVSSGTFNYAPSNPELRKRMETDIEQFLNANPGVKREQIPADLMTASGSGLDPHISVDAAHIQMKRVAQSSGLSLDEIKAIVKNNTESRVFGLFGEDKVNVLGANLDIFKQMKEK
ncbi:K+-transporting ATPase ATPase C chain [Oikeobacillus pervagus]|uniref:Potassium-transporting ATPase KdpC subunit n=1 Tax=Oikeobacillus pervagus TaxID=1325931 RepID=A0AAJ1SXC2_9BACI|nr:K(+)-transporting ATPase subunit C [Oikeobacillus pervagus]MDQ0214495.1 K+-transporting ATPase ATPase C chain [Oikeobacillus pervagus]